MLFVLLDTHKTGTLTSPYALTLAIRNSVTLRMEMSGVYNFKCFVRDGVERYFSIYVFHGDGAERCLKF